MHAEFLGQEEILATIECRVSTKMPNPCGILEGRGFDKSLRKCLQGFANPRTQIPTVLQVFKYCRDLKVDLQFSPCRVLHMCTTTIA
jgi:hypothetical protein